jgi:hypothetical protein
MKPSNIMYEYNETSLTAEQLAARGYRRVSVRHRHVARIDRPDWLSVLAQHLSVDEVQGTAVWCDYYRRVLSRDCLTVPEDVLMNVPPSCGDDCAYVPLPRGTKDRRAVGDTMGDDDLRKLWRAAGGEFHGPHVETGCMPESKLLPFLRSLLNRGV